ncbi:MAG: hypothetical protein DYH08_11255 [Actinobacteria bacterium ATB1]|nr:hypothetical protein [Actinobacteria bacterium ATB1]
MGNVLSAGLGQAPARQAALKAGLDNGTQAVTLNKMCGSGLQAVAMARLGPEWACLQGKLNFYESRRNLLTRWFSTEYSTWFACYLPGLVSARGIVPLGGTSNHFRRDALAAVGAWDASTSPRTRTSVSACSATGTGSASSTP